MEPVDAGEWAEFVLVVRNISGSVDQWVYEWELNHRYNQRFGKKFKARKIGNDIIKAPPASPIPSIAYFLIKRTEVAKRVIFFDNEQKETLYKGYLYYNGTYNVVTIRKMRPKLYNQKAFDKDIKRLNKTMQSSKDGGSKQDANVGKIRNGFQFLSHIVGFGGDPIEVSAGMRFLELNSLCHRHLRGSNIIVHEEGSHMYGVKITDYMVTYHFLDEEWVEKINLFDLDWPWWAPECVLYRCFDIVSDVWAFGCVIFEINHDGLGPYAFQKRRPQSHRDLQSIFESGEQMCIVREDDAESFLEELLFMCIRYNPDDDKILKKET
ncbi:hypothetical protein NECAME_03400 [Necator americanus]|uniref:Protein kinase domain-containing protein n=1 Tax=Necator americanus TaxID=51031 RepID=W2T3Y6_NECAM|nr:hypothetical protein NECAME_03400 [Necator americanus]ETN76730.1 hypothetical protein NECAME_03400 [Necator americanus]